MPKIQAMEVQKVLAECPPGADEEDWQLTSSEAGHLERMFEEDLVPTMRYSFVVFLHTAFETRLRVFCRIQQKEQNIQIGLSDLQGSPIAQAKKFLTKLVGLNVGKYGEWDDLCVFQDVRDCIVHCYGYMNPERHGKLMKRLSTMKDAEITRENRLAVSPEFCKRHLSVIQKFFKRLYAAEHDLLNRDGPQATETKARTKT